jgi:hypothetical protein
MFPKHITMIKKCCSSTFIETTVNAVSGVPEVFFSGVVNGRQISFLELRIFLMIF